MNSLTIITPVYNEATVIGQFYSEMCQVLDSISASYAAKILFVVDPSDDGSLEILRTLAESDSRVQVVSMSARFGHQMALLAGIDHANADAVVMLDSDLQHPPDLIPTMLTYFEQGYDIVYTLRKDTPDINFFKRTSSKLFYRMVNRLSDVPINESAADFRLISRRVAQVFQTQLRERNMFLRGLFSWVGFKSYGIPFEVRRRHSGKSKYSITRMIRFGLHGVISFSKSPLHAATILGFSFAFFGFLTALITFIQFFLIQALPSGWTTIIILITIFSGTQLICLGIIGEYISAIFDEVKARPHYIIDEKINL